MYKGLSRAQLSFDYLHTNSTTHEFLFGALAELLDNARDAYATKINIHSVSDSTLRGGYMLCFLDDGQGMSPEEASDIITFGKSTKKSLDSHMIGKYGNGLKSGSMRIGNDLMLFTKKDSALTCVFLSRTFHEREQLEEIIVPMPSFDANTKRPLAKTPREKEKHVQEMELILKYSPFRTDAQFMKEFDKIEGTSGTLVIVYNLKLLDTGEPELDVKTDPYDILLSSADDDTNEGLLPERKSFRSYASILYVDPHMRVYIQGKKVRTKRIVNTLYKPRSYKYTSARFRARSEKEAKKAEEDARNAEFRAREAESKAKDLEIKLGMMPDKEQRIELRRAQTHALELRKEAQLRKAISERKNKSLKEPKQLVFVFGINLENRSRDGVFVYNCSRLIKMYQKIGPQLDGGVLCNGVVGVVDAPYLVLEPTHNKQDFADAKEYRHLQQAMGEHMLQYWRDIDIAQQGVSKFWENFGYISPNWHALPSSDPKYIRKRTAQVQITLQCDLCLKWRIIPYSSNNINKVFPDDWVCSMNPDPAHNRCSAPEEKLNLPEGILKKMPKSKEQKEKDLEEEIKRKQSLLDKMQRNDPKRRVDSSPSSMSSIHSEDVENSSHGSEATRGNKAKQGLCTHSSEIETTAVRKQHNTPSKHPPQKGIPQCPSHSSLKISTQRPMRNFGASISSAISSVHKHAPSNKHTVLTKSIQHSMVKEPTRRPASDISLKHRSSPSPVRRSYKIPRRDKVRRSTDRSSSNHSNVNSDDDFSVGQTNNSSHGDFDDEDDDYDSYSDKLGEKRRKMSIPSLTYEKKKNFKLKEKLKNSTGRHFHEDVVTASNRSAAKTATNSNSKARTVSPVTARKDYDDDVEDDDDDDDDDDGLIESIRGDEGRRNRGLLTVGRKVKAMVQKFWIEGEVVEESISKETCRVRFNSSFHGITDMWFPKASHDIQVLEDKNNSPLEANESSPSNNLTNDTNGVVPSTTPSDSGPLKNGLNDDHHHHPSPLNEAPLNGATDLPEESQSNAPVPCASADKTFNSCGTNTTFDLQAYEEIANGFRTCLRYFLPPQWYMDKETVSSLATQDLSTFPLDDFFDQYEKGLRKLVSSFQHEAQVKQCEAEQSSSKLSTVRRMIAKLLKTINEDFEIDSECDTDEVDDLLALCLRQALEHARGSSEQSN